MSYSRSDADEKIERDIERYRDRMYARREASESSGFRILFGILFSAVTLLYMLPTGVSLIRNGRNKLPIFLLNLFLGWTFIGWVVALVWAAKPRD